MKKEKAFRCSVSGNYLVSLTPNPPPKKLSPMAYETGLYFKCNIWVWDTERQKDRERKSFNAVYHVMTWISPMGTSVT